MFSYVLAQSSRQLGCKTLELCKTVGLINLGFHYNSFHSLYRNPIMKCKGLLQGLLADRVFEYGEFDCDVEFMP